MNIVVETVTALKFNIVKLGSGHLLKKAIALYCIDKVNGNSHYNAIKKIT